MRVQIFLHPDRWLFIYRDVFLCCACGIIFGNARAVGGNVEKAGWKGRSLTKRLKANQDTKEMVVFLLEKE